MPMIHRVMANVDKILETNVDRRIKFQRCYIKMKMAYLSDSLVVYKVYKCLFSTLLFFFKTVGYFCATPYHLFILLFIDIHTKHIKKYKPPFKQKKIVCTNE